MAFVYWHRRNCMRPRGVLDKKKCFKAPDHVRGDISAITLHFLTLPEDCLLSTNLFIYKCCCFIYVFLNLCFTLTIGIKCSMLVSIIRANSALMENYLWLSYFWHCAIIFWIYMAWIICRPFFQLQISRNRRYSFWPYNLRNAKKLFLKVAFQ